MIPLFHALAGCLVVAVCFLLARSGSFVSCTGLMHGGLCSFFKLVLVSSFHALVRCMVVSVLFFTSCLCLRFMSSFGACTLSLFSSACLHFNAKPVLFSLPVQSCKVHVMSLLACMHHFCHAIEILTSRSLEAYNEGLWS